MLNKQPKYLEKRKMNMPWWWKVCVTFTVFAAFIEFTFTDTKPIYRSDHHAPFAVEIVDLKSGEHSWIPY